MLIVRGNISQVPTEGISAIDLPEEGGEEEE